MKYSSFLKRNKQEIQKGIILVIGKHMNRTALGIVEALLIVYPKLSFEELKEMLPDTINPSAPKNYKSLFAPYNPNRKYGVVQPSSIKKEAIENGLDINASHFTEKEETFIMNDGIEILVSKSWESSDTLTGENDLQNLINHVKQYGIIVNDTEPISEPFKTGSYKLYILNNELLKEVNNIKKTNYLFLGIAVAIIISLITLYLVTKS
jgi:hypothetical protein